MTINHRAEAEQHLATAARHLTELPADMRIAEVAASIGQGHATLARNEEQAATTADMRDALAVLRKREYATRELVSAHIAQALASRERDRWGAGRDLAKALDEADCNMDELIDNWLTDDGWDARSAWKVPASATRTAAPADDPWAATPDITAEVPGPVRRVLAEYLAAALLSKGDAQGVGQTITFALKHAGADLTGDIEKRISELTLGHDPSDPPF
jgi:hypothetical protein